VAVAFPINWVTFVVAVLMGLAAWFVYLWAVRSGQWKSVEEPAQRLLEQDARETVPKEPSR
jgi:cbb3-type cytochrome oxidase maturation protein